MMGYRIIFLLISILLIPDRALVAQPDNIKIIIHSDDEPKGYYKIGDVIKLNITVIQSGKYCMEGIDKIRLFTKGLKIENQESWIKTAENKWEKHLSVIVTGNKTGELQLTAYRKTDKGTIVEKFESNLKNKGNG